MDIIILRKKGNLMLNLDFFGNNFFLKKIYPEGIYNSIFIKDIMISLNGNSEFSFFIKQEPLFPVKKWGKWEEDFNALWVKTSSNVRFKGVLISNPDRLGFNKLDIYVEDFCQIFISQKENSHVNLSLFKNDRFIIQNVIPIFI
jgi:conserved uncharacterized protein